jgi:hypothetical protein
MAPDAPRQTADALPVPLTFRNLEGIPRLVHGVFTRHGGVSPPPYATLNVAWTIGDRSECVAENLRRVGRALAVEHLVAARQVHGDTIRIIDADALAAAAAHLAARVVPSADALVTHLQGCGLMIKIADCQAVFLVDPERQVIANVHCGWRGSVTNILGKVVRCLEERFGSRPEALLAAVSPSLGPCCGEFRHYHEELPEAFWAYRAPGDRFDFWAISRRQLTAAGLREDRIEVAERCTVCERRDFFSYRGERLTGRMAAVIAWNGHEHR